MKKRAIACIIIVFVISAFLISFYRSKNSLEVSHYTINSEKINDSVRIVQLSDLHNSTFGQDNSRLIQNVKHQDPDFILVTGDLINSDTENIDSAVALLEELSSICPVYVSLGNHEIDYKQNHSLDIISQYESADATVLDKEYVDIDYHGSQLRIGGIFGYCLPDSYMDSKQYSVDESTFLTEFQNTDRYTILMCHMPVCWLLNNGLNEWNVNLVVSGHVHGGQIRIPLIGGVYAPDFGWFPGRLSGIYSSDDQLKHLVISRGLGSNEKIPRLNNIPEIMIIDIKGT